MNVVGLKTAVEKSNAIFNKIKGKYNKLSGYLVLSSPYGQCNLTTDLIQILKEFPEMITESPQKKKALEIKSKISLLEKKDVKNKDDKAQTLRVAKSDLPKIVDKLEIKGDTFIEIRFNEANLDLIAELQKNEFISQKYTPQTKSSIRIVLGALEDLQ